jgi:hypothetical protein
MRRKIVELEVIPALVRVMTVDGNRAVDFASAAEIFNRWVFTLSAKACVVENERSEGSLTITIAARGGGGGGDGEGGEGSGGGGSGGGGGGGGGDGGSGKGEGEGVGGRGLQSFVLDLDSSNSTTHSRDELDYVVDRSAQVELKWERVSAPAGWRGRGGGRRRGRWRERSRRAKRPPRPAGGHDDRHGILRPGGAVQVDPMKPSLKPPGSKRLKASCDILLPNSAFKVNVRRYTQEMDPLIPCSVNTMSEYMVEMVLTHAGLNPGVIQEVGLRVSL